SIELQGSSLQVGINGKLVADTLNGTVKFGDFGEFPFAGKRAAAGAPTPPPPAAAATPPSAANGPASDVSGKWDSVLMFPGAMEFPVAADIKQDGNKLTGKLIS